VKTLTRNAKNMANYLHYRRTGSLKLLNVRIGLTLNCAAQTLWIKVQSLTDEAERERRISRLIIHQPQPRPFANILVTAKEIVNSTLEHRCKEAQLRERCAGRWNIRI
jgi:hypothetical protein